MSTVCAHGRLRRACDICERDEDIAALRKALAELLAAVKTVGDPSLREMVVKRAVKRAEGAL